MNLSDKDIKETILFLLNDFEDYRFLLVGENEIIQNIKEVLGSKRRYIFLNKEGNLSREAQKFKSDFHLAAGDSNRIIDHLRQDSTRFSNIKGIIFLLPAQIELMNSQLGDFSFLLSRIITVKKVFLLNTLPSLSRDSYPFLKSTHEISLESMKERNVAKIADEMISAMDELVTKTKADNDPEKLTEYKKIFKKCIPLGFRGWVTAYLLREYLSKNKSMNMPVLKKSTTLFVGIGKNRKVYPKDLIHLFINTGKIERNHIGEIRILDNYAFVSVEKISADKAIDNLNGINYRGRSLNVNYAKQKESNA